MTGEQTAEQQIADQMAGREAYIGKLQAIGDGNEPQAFDGDYDGEMLEPDAAWDRLDELPLGLSTYRIVRIELSIGGPADYIEAKLDANDEVETVTYHFADWFDHASRAVPEDSALWRFAERYVEALDSRES